MLSHWPIRTKLKLGLGLMLMTVLALFGSAYYGLYAYRDLVKTLSARSAELPLAAQISQNVVDLRDVLIEANEELELSSRLQSLTTDQSMSPEYNAEFSWWDAPGWREEYRARFEELITSLERYREQLDQNIGDRDPRLGDDTAERETLLMIDAVVKRISGGQSPSQLEADWILDPSRIGVLREEMEQIRQLVTKLPSHLHTQFQELAVDVRAQYRTAIVSAWVNTGLALILLGFSTRLFIKWFAQPLQTLVDGSREVARGNFGYQITLDTHDELGELAKAMNAMTARFRVIRDDLDQKVRERTNQVVRSEQLASVGFLAAGVSHEINNPLASIALCSESLEGRLSEILNHVDDSYSGDVQVARDYLQMIQREAFRCKQITEKLLDFARMGDKQRNSTELRDLAKGVCDMVQHLGQYQDKKLELLPGEPVIAEVNSQEIKQVVLNLITNGLESLDAGGTVRVTVERDGLQARIIVEDNGCGMTEEVQQHLFKPFYTRRRGGQGIGLGLSITHRIVEEHQGSIEVTSEGVGRGAKFVVSLPAHQLSKEKHHRYQAA